jgi:hypothetical protein
MKEQLRAGFINQMCVISLKDENMMCEVGFAVITQ